MSEPLRVERDPAGGATLTHTAGGAMPASPATTVSVPWQSCLAHPWRSAALLLALPAPNPGAWLTLHLYFPVIAFIAASFGWPRAAAATVLAIACTLLLAGDAQALTRGQHAALLPAALLALVVLIGLCGALRRARLRIRTLQQHGREQARRLNLMLAAGSIGTFDIELGRDPTDAVMQLWHLATELIDRERLTALVVARLQRGEQDVRVEYRIVRANGTSRWLELRGHVAFGEDDRPLRLYGMTLDVSERQAAEEQLRQSQAMFDKLFTCSPFGAGQLDTDGRFIRVNAAFCALVGHAAQFRVGRSFLDITHPADRPANEAGYSRIMRGELQQYVVRKRFVRADGSVVLVNVCGNLVRDQDGLPQFAIAIVTPVDDGDFEATPGAGDGAHGHAAG